jgi:phage terminase small subunit
MSKRLALTEFEQKFCVEYVKTGSPHDSYVCGYSTSGMKQSTINRQAQKVLKRPLVAARIAELREKANAAMQYDVNKVLRQWAEIADADPNELTQHRRVNCRYCHGTAHQYRWRDEEEFALACAKAIDDCRPRKEPNLPTDDGGYGFRKNDAPHDGCSRCCGEGVSIVHITDSRRLTGAAKRLYAGVRIKKGAVEVLFRDQDAALKNLAKALGIIKYNVTSPSTGNNSTVVPASLNAIGVSDPVEASEVYQRIIGGG